MSYSGISDHLEEVTKFLKSTVGLYNSRWDSIFQIEKDTDVIENWVKRTVDQMCISYGSLATPKDEIDKQIRKTSELTTIDFKVTEKINQNTDMMSPAEQETVYNTLNAIRVDTRDILLNHAEISNYGIEVISESLKHADRVHRLDLSHITNKIGKLVNVYFNR